MERTHRPAAQRAGQPIAKALSNPLTLVRDTYRSGDDIRELLDFCDAVGDVSGEDIQDHLLDRVLPAAYTPPPGEPAPRYGLEEARRALGYIAARMSQEGTRDLSWWRIPAWAPAAPRVIVTGAAFGVMFISSGTLACRIASPCRPHPNEPLLSPTTGNTQPNSIAAAG